VGECIVTDQIGGHITVAKHFQQTTETSIGAPGTENRDLSVSLTEPALSSDEEEPTRARRAQLSLAPSHPLPSSPISMHRPKPPKSRKEILEKILNKA
jgi:hypothetical protein